RTESKRHHDASSRDTALSCQRTGSWEKETIAMAHTHASDDTYYLDQLCLIGISAAFGGICLALYFSMVFWQPPSAVPTGTPAATVQPADAEQDEGQWPMLKRLLDKDFHPFILMTGIALMVLVLLRSIALWRTVAAKSAANHAHDHDHSHAHDHDH